MLEKLIVYVFLSNLEDIVGFLAVFRVRLVVDERIILIHNFAETVGLALVYRQGCLLITRFQHKKFQFFLIFRVRIILYRVFGHNHSRVIIVAKISAKVVIELSVLQLFERQLILQFKDSLLGDRINLEVKWS